MKLPQSSYTAGEFGQEMKLPQSSYGVEKTNIRHGIWSCHSLHISGIMGLMGDPYRKGTGCCELPFIIVSQKIFLWSSLEHCFAYVCLLIISLHHSKYIFNVQSCKHNVVSIKVFLISFRLTGYKQWHISSIRHLRHDIAHTAEFSSAFTSRFPLGWVAIRQFPKS